MVTDVLEEILSRRRAHVAEAKKKIGLGSLQNELKTASPIRPFFDSLVRTGHISVIAEMKKKSPSAGLLKNDYDVTVIARNYEKGGAKALSVLTEPDRFGGSVSDLSKARAAVGLPVLEKDFIFDPYQIIEARVWGADAVLLIADMLEESLLKELADVARELGVEPLVEVFTKDSVEPALKSGARLIGINTRNLRTLTMHSDNVAVLSALIPADRAIVAESGIKTPDDVRKLAPHKVKAILVGESLLKQSDPIKATHELAEAV